MIREDDIDGVARLSGWFLIVVVVCGLATGMRAAIFNILSERIARNLRKDYYTTIVEKDIAFFDDRRTGDIISRLNSDVMVVQETLSNNFSMVSRACLGIIASLVIMLFLSLELTGICFCGIVPLAFFTIFY